MIIWNWHLYGSPTGQPCDHIYQSLYLYVFAEKWLIVYCPFYWLCHPNLHKIYTLYMYSLRLNEWKGPVLKFVHNRTSYLITQLTSYLTQTTWKGLFITGLFHSSNKRSKVQELDALTPSCAVSKSLMPLENTLHHIWILFYRAYYVNVKYRNLHFSFILSAFYWKHVTAE